MGTVANIAEIVFLLISASTMVLAPLLIALTIVGYKVRVSIALNFIVWGALFLLLVIIAAESA